MKLTEEEYNTWKSMLLDPDNAELAIDIIDEETITSNLSEIKYILTLLWAREKLCTPVETIIEKLYEGITNTENSHILFRDWLSSHLPSGMHHYSEKILWINGLLRELINND